jgi:signal transduction histidine kinase
VELGYTILQSELSGFFPKIENPESSIVFWVRDNGLGLTEEQQQRLFTQFTRMHEMRAEGYGLGLSIVERIVRKLGGAVGVESQAGAGSTFWFTLPAADEAIEQRAVA